MEKLAGKSTMDKENHVKKKSVSNKVNKGLQMHSEKHPNLQNKTITGGDNSKGTGTIKKCIEKKEKKKISKKCLEFDDDSVVFVPVITTAPKKRAKNKDNGLSGKKNRGKLDDGNESAKKKIPTIDLTEDDVSAKPQFKMLAEKSPPNKQEAGTIKTRVRYADEGTEILHSVSATSDKSAEDEDYSSAGKRKRVVSTDTEVEILLTINTTPKKLTENVDNGLNGIINGGKIGDEYKSEETKITAVDLTGNDASAEPLSKKCTDEDPLKKQEEVTKNVAADGNNDLVDLDALFAQSPRLGSLPALISPLPITPTDAHNATLITQKVKVEHRKGKRITTKTKTKKKDTDYTYEAIRYKLPYEDNLIEFELAKEEIHHGMARGYRIKYCTLQERAVMIEMLAEMAADHRWPSYIMYQAVKIFDTVLDSGRISADSIDLLALASMWVALKREQISCKVPRAAAMISYLDDPNQSQEDLVRCEIELLQALDFKIVFPDPYLLLCYYITSCVRSRNMLIDLVKKANRCGRQMIDLSLPEEDLMEASAILLAAAAAEAALFITMDKIQPQPEPIWFEWRSPEAASRFREQEIAYVRTKLIELIRANVRQDIIFKKYSG